MDHEPDNEHKAEAQPSLPEAPDGAPGPGSQAPASAGSFLGKLWDNLWGGGNISSPASQSAEEGWPANQRAREDLDTQLTRQQEEDDFVRRRLHDDLRFQQERLRKEREAEQKEFSARLEQLLSELDQQAGEIVRLRQQLQSSRDSSGAELPPDLEDAHDQLRIEREQREEALREADDLKGELARLQEDHHIQTGEARSRLEDAQARADSFKADAESSRRQVSSLQAELETSRQQVSSLQAELETSRRQVFSLMAELQSSRSSAADLQLQIENLRSQLSAFEASEEFRLRLGRAEKDAERSREEADLLRAELVPLRSQLGELQSHLAEAERLLAQARQSERDRYRQSTQTQALQEEMETIRSRSQRLEEQVRDFYTHAITSLTVLKVTVDLMASTRPGEPDFESMEEIRQKATELQQGMHKLQKGLSEIGVSAGD